MPHPFLIFSQSDYLIQVVDINSYTESQTVQIQISWLLKKPTDLDLHCLQRQVYSGSAGQGLSISIILHLVAHEASENFIVLVKRGIWKIFFLFLHENILVLNEALLMGT